MMTLTCLLPIMIRGYVPSNDEHWECFLLLWDICSMICVYEMTSDDLVWMMQTYMECFEHLYGVLLQKCMHQN